MCALADALMAKKHDPEKRCLEKEGGQDLVAEKRPRDIAGPHHEAGPVRPELEAHRDSADDAEREAQREDLGPEAIGRKPRRIPGVQPARTKEEQRPAERDADRREQDMKRHVGGELHARQRQGIHRSLRVAARSEVQST